LLDTVLLYNGVYFKLGVKRTFQELKPLHLSPVFEENIKIFDDALENFIINYDRVGISPKHYKDVDEFVKEYKRIF
jgi:hypothetical protein